MGKPWAPGKYKKQEEKMVTKKKREERYAQSRRKTSPEFVTYKPGL